MATVPAPSLVAREEWPDADFDLPEGQSIHAVADKDDDEDWDIEMDLGKTGGGKAAVTSKEPDSSQAQSQMFIIRPPPSLNDIGDDEDDEGVSTIKVTFPKSSDNPLQRAPDDDFEDAFALPSDLTQLSLAPLSLNHRSSKSSIEWGGDKDHTSSSQSSDAYSSLGFADASPSSNSTSSASLPETETEDDDEDEGALEGLVIPSDLFETGKGGRHLTKLLEMKKAAVAANNHLKVASPDPEDDFEMGLVIDDDVDLSPSRLLYNAQQSHRTVNRSLSMPAQRLRPPSRLKPDRAKSPVNPPMSSARQLQKLRLSPSPPLHPRTQSFQPLTSAPSSSSSFLTPKPTNLRGQKSHSGLKPFTPPPDARRLPRKASLSSLLESSQSQASGSGSGPSERSSKARYEEPTAASRAKSHKSSLGRLDFKVPPTRPSTPSNNPAALRLTMPTQSRLRTRPTLSAIGWNPPITPSIPSPSFRTSSPLPRPPSNLSLRAARSQTALTPPSARVLKRPKRARHFGDGTELDGIEDLPTDRDQESRFRVQPKGYGNRIPGGSYSLKPSDKGTIRKKGRRDVSSGTTDVVTALAPATNAPKRPPRTDMSPKKKKTNPSAAASHRRKPTLIRNLSGVGSARVVGDMKWNPQALRWEGNEHVLREFDAVVTSTRPALITHLTGSSIGSPVGAFASGARIVGNMMFDPKRMCWLSTLPPDEDEPDVFANLADDEEDGDGWESRGGTIRASLQTTSVNSSCTGIVGPTFTATVEAPSPARSHASACGSDRGSRGSMVCDPDAAFAQRCRSAEERHRQEMKGWRTAQDIFAAPNRSYLYEIRAVATRSYS